MRELFERIVRILLDFKSRIVELETAWSFQSQPGPYLVYTEQNGPSTKEHKIPFLRDGQFRADYLPAATSENDGIMSAEDKEKLDNLLEYGIETSQIISAGATSLFGIRAKLTYPAGTTPPPLIFNVYGIQEVMDSMGGTNIGVVPLKWKASFYQSDNRDLTYTDNFTFTILLDEPLDVDLPIRAVSNYELYYAYM